MNPHISVIRLGVEDLSRAKQFYSEGLGFPIHMDQGSFVSFSPSDGSSALALYPSDVVASPSAAAPPPGIPRPAAGSPAARHADDAEPGERGDRRRRVRHHPASGWLP
jgi:hypothetical protein